MHLAARRTCVACAAQPALSLTDQATLFAGGNDADVRKTAGAPQPAGRFSSELARWIVRLLVVAAAAFALTGCQSLSPRAESPPSLDNADALARQGDLMGAAHMYEALAGQNSGADRNEYLFRAARSFLIARRPEETARVLAELEEPLTAQETAERPLLEVELALARGQGQQAWQRITTLPEPRTSTEALHYWR